MPTAISIIRDDRAYEAALAEYENYFDKEPAPGSPEADRFELLGLLLAKYEDEHYRFTGASPADVIRLVMENSGRSQSDLADLVNSRARASELLSGKRLPSLDQIRRLRSEWRIPADALIGELEMT